MRRLGPRSSRPILTSLFALSLLSLPIMAHAAPKDAAAQKLYDQAMDEDYLNVEFDKAIGKLDKALKDCGGDGCSPTMVGKLHVAKGVVYAGKNEVDKAKAAFVEAFKADPNAKPLDDFMTPEAKDAFDAAKKEAGSATPKPGPKPAPSGDDDDDGAPAAGGDLEWDPPTEAQINTPLPIFVADDGLGAEGMTVRYKPFGATKWLRVKMKPMQGGFGAEIPCSEVTTLGDLRLYVIVEDSAGDPIATAGTLKRPLTIKIKNKLEGDQPSFPGQKPPAKCMTASDCPPDFPGCAPAGDDDDDGRGDKGWGASCDSTKECRSGFVCLNGVCEEGEDDGDSGGSSEDGGMRHFVSLGLQLDILSIGSTESVCGEAETVDDRVTPVPGYACFEDDEPFDGKPTDQLNAVQGGGALASMRILAGYDMVYWKGLGWGLRIGGVPWGGSPATDTDSFVPFHAELRILQLHPAYFLGNDGFLGGVLNPYVFAGLGFGHVDAGVDTRVCDLAGTGSRGSCDAGAATDVTAYFRTGDLFFLGGLGSAFIFNPDSSIRAGVNLELKLMGMFGNGAGRDTGFAFSPYIGPIVSF